MPIELAPGGAGDGAVDPALRRRYALDVERRLRALLDADLPVWRAGPRSEGLAHLDRFLAQSCTTLRERLTVGSATPDSCLQTVDLIAALEALRREHLDRTVRERLTALAGVTDLLAAAPEPVDVADLLARAAREAARICGLDRVMIFRLHESRLIPEVTYFVGHAERAAEVHELARRNPVELTAVRYEVEMIRRRAAALITEPRDDPRFWGPTLGELDTAGFVSVPIVAGGIVVATLHGDTGFSGRQVDVLDRDCLAAFGKGLGHALERAVLIERLHSQRDAALRLARAAEAAVDEFGQADFARREPGFAGEEPRARRMPVRPSTPPGLAGVTLTPREAEVLALMSTGAGNGDISRRLVIAEATVKSHVKHVLRKIGATNRAQAISIYLGAALERPA
ncbi:MAG TPA: LuxR C-terminal-related transcriptional regulator [Sporichthyaceae bacterium]|nr:LuxR C-terminal-related transcriptional regulator [Sporichthyaceae bacterium]